MDNIEKKSKEIRDLLRHPWHRSKLWDNRLNFNQVFTSLDTIEDAQRGIIAYHGLPEFNSSSGGYLYIYGLMQSLFLQQDGTRHLYNALFGESIKLKEEYPELQIIREHRNLAVGHPTNTTRGKSKAFTYVVRSSVSKKRFEYLTHYPVSNDKSAYIKVNTSELLENQHKNILAILKEIESKIMEEFEKHKSKFKGSKIMDLMEENSIGYYFQHLVKDVGDEVFQARIGLEIINKIYQKVKLAVIERYHSTFAVQGIEHNFEFIDYLIERLQRDLVDNQIEDQKELYVFIDALQGYFDELIEMCKEIDNEFSK